MTTVREPRIHPIAITDLRPTQITVGMREVKAKRQSWRNRDENKRPDFLGSHMIPVIRGPKDRIYVVDHHHLARALHDEGEKTVAVSTFADLHMLDTDEFWNFLDCRAWMHPVDSDGKRQSYKALPKTVADLADDPFRSLAGELRRAGGFAKDTTPFSEFIWADFLRRRIKRGLVEDDFSAALEQALSLAKSHDADYMPGWCGPIFES